jgi:hypothetical protein
MADLNPCAKCQSPAIEQVRGKMGPGDYKQVQKVNEKGHFVDDLDHYKKVRLDDDIRDDIRVSCTKCDNATGWNKPDAPGMPGVGATFTRDLWNKLNPAAAQAAEGARDGSNSVT